MATYTVNQGITTPSGKRLEVGTVVTEDDLTQAAVKWLLADGVLTAEDNESAVYKPARKTKQNTNTEGEG